MEAELEMEKQDQSPKKENNNSVFVNLRSPEKKANGVPEISNISIVNTLDINPMRNVRNGEAEDVEVKRTKVIRKGTYIKIMICMSEVLLLII